MKRSNIRFLVLLKVILAGSLLIQPGFGQDRSISPFNNDQASPADLGAVPVAPPSASYPQSRAVAVSLKPVVPLLPTQTANQEGRLYYLEFAVFSNALQAKLLARKLTSQGAPCTALKTEAGKHRVISDGYFASFKDARQASLLVKKQAGFTSKILAE